mgnify:FL=1
MSLSLSVFRQYSWTSANGTGKRICELETSHILNILNWIKRYPAQYADGTYELFEEEVAYRMIIDFANGAPTPYKDADGQWGVVDPIANRKRVAKDAATKMKLYEAFEKDKA